MRFCQLSLERRAERGRPTSTNISLLVQDEIYYETSCSSLSRIAQLSPTTTHIVLFKMLPSFFEINL